MEDVITIKRYNMAQRAHLDAALLRDRGIECQVDGSDVVNTPLPGGEQVSLLVRASDSEAALRILADSAL